MNICSPYLIGGDAAFDPKEPFSFRLCGKVLLLPKIATKVNNK
jgi:hypothetical protein